MNKLLLVFCACLWSISIQAQDVSGKDFGSWSLLCGDKGNCALSQLVSKDAEAKQVMLGASINYALSADFPILMLRMPPMAIQSAGVGIKIDGNKAIQVPMSQCNAQACQSVIKMDAQLIRELSAGNVARIAYAVDGPNQVTLPLSLDGFEAAFSALNEKMK